jgi:hypothetical protein
MSYNFSDGSSTPADSLPGKLNITTKVTNAGTSPAAFTIVHEPHFTGGTGAPNINDFVITYDQSLFTAQWSGADVPETGSPAMIPSGTEINVTNSPSGALAGIDFITFTPKRTLAVGESTSVVWTPITTVSFVDFAAENDADFVQGCSPPVEPLLTVVKSAPALTGTPPLGTSVVYSFVVTNNGTADASTAWSPTTKSQPSRVRARRSRSTAR